MRPAQPPRARRRWRGLTLLELAIVLAVLAILAAAAAPPLAARMDRQRLEHAAEQLAADLAEARFAAAQRGAALHWVADAGPAWCWAVVAAPGCGCGSAQPCQLKRVPGDEHAGVRLLAAAPATLAPTGEAGQPQTVAVLGNRRGDSLRVEIGTLGRPRVCALAGSLPRHARC